MSNVLEYAVPYVRRVAHTETPQAYHTMMEAVVVVIMIVMMVMVMVMVLVLVLVMVMVWRW